MSKRLCKYIVDGRLVCPWRYSVNDRCRFNHPVCEEYKAKKSCQRGDKCPYHHPGRARLIRLKERETLLADQEKCGGWTDAKQLVEFASKLRFCMPKPRYPWEIDPNNIQSWKVDAVRSEREIPYYEWWDRCFRYLKRSNKSFFVTADYQDDIEQLKDFNDYSDFTHIRGVWQSSLNTTRKVEAVIATARWHSNCYSVFIGALPELWSQYSLVPRTYEHFSLCDERYHAVFNCEKSAPLVWKLRCVIDLQDATITRLIHEVDDIAQDLLNVAESDADIKSATFVAAVVDAKDSKTKVIPVEATTMEATTMEATSMKATHGIVMKVTGKKSDTVHIGVWKVLPQLAFAHPSIDEVEYQSYHCQCEFREHVDVRHYVEHDGGVSRFQSETMTTYTRNHFLAVILEPERNLLISKCKALVDVDTKMNLTEFLSLTRPAYCPKAHKTLNGATKENVKSDDKKKITAVASVVAVSTSAKISEIEVLALLKLLHKRELDDPSIRFPPHLFCWSGVHLLEATISTNN